jgi:hypothetical protein
MILNILLIILTIILVGFITLVIIFWVKYGKILISLFKEMKKFTPMPNLKNHKQMFSEIDSMLKTLNNKNGKRF